MNGFHNNLISRERQTISQILQWSYDYFQGHGVSSPRLDGEVILAEILNTDRTGLYLRSDQCLEKEDLAAFLKLAERRACREPVPYIVGHREFWSLDFLVSPSVLIPRPETELLVEEAIRILTTLPAPSQPVKVLELGTGSGAISVALAREVPFISIVAVDISREAVAIARANAERHNVADRIEFVVGDLSSALRERTSAFFLLLSNPPYIPTSELNGLAPEIRLFEPREALDGGEDGMDCHRRILIGTLPFIQAGGWILLEVHDGQSRVLADFMFNSGNFQQVEIHPDYQGVERLVKGKKR